MPYQPVITEEEVWDDLESDEPECSVCGDTDSVFCSKQLEYLEEYQCLSECCACLGCVSCGSHIPRRLTLEVFFVRCARLVGINREQFINAVIAHTFGTRGTWRSFVSDLHAWGELNPILCPTCIAASLRTTSVEFPITEYEEQSDDETVVKPQWSRRNASACMTWHDQDQIHFWSGAECEEFPNVFVGAEIECDRGGSAALRQKVLDWKSNVRSDGSVSAGFEVATAPASGDKFVQLINEITEECKKAHGLITPRCGLHIHVDCRDLDDQKRLLLTGLWCLFEHHFIAMMPPSRRGQNRLTSSQYCKPLSPRWRAMQGVAKGTETPAQMLGFLLNRRFSAPNYHSGDRYKAWNLQALGKYRTIECRLHSGTLQADKIIPWAAILASLKLAVVNMTTEQLVAHLSQPRPTRELLLELLWNDQCRNYVIDRQESFKEYNTPDALVALLNPVNEYRDALANLTE